MHSPLLITFLIVCFGAIPSLSAPQKPPQISKSIDPPAQSVNSDKVDISYAMGKCQLPVHLGTTCATAKPAVKWFYEPHFGVCLAFKYNGCGGNENRFNDEGECMQCRPMDMAGCAGLGGPVKDAKGEGIYCNQPQFMMPGQDAKPKEECPKGSQCMNMGMLSLCCDTAKQEKFNANYSPKCAGGKKPASYKSGGFESSLLGQSCKHDFCPNGFVCKQLELFAHCCPK